MFTGKEDIIILHGNDELTINESISRLHKSAGGFADLNTSTLNAREASHADIAMQLNMLPLGVGKRVVIIEHAQEALRSKTGKKWILSILESFPPSTQLVLILDDQQKYRKGGYDWVKFNQSHWLRKALQDFTGVHFWQEHILPGAKQMPGWIMNKAESMGGDFHPSAAHTLANLVGSDLFQAQHEIEKGIAYAGAGHQVSAEDVQLLCAASKEEGVYDLVDAVAQRDGKTAMRIFQKLRIDMHEMVIFSLICRQMRLLLQARLVLDKKGAVQEVMNVCDVSSKWLANKLMNQARRFRVSELENMYAALDRMDENSKNGVMPLDTAIEVFIAKLTQ